MCSPRAKLGRRPAPLGQRPAVSGGSSRGGRAADCRAPRRCLHRRASRRSWTARRERPPDTEHGREHRSPNLARWIQRAGPSGRPGPRPLSRVHASAETERRTNATGYYTASRYPVTPDLDQPENNDYTERAPVRWVLHRPALNPPCRATHAESAESEQRHDSRNAPARNPTPTPPHPNQHACVRAAGQ